MRAERAANSRRYWAAFLFLVLGAGTGVWHNRRVETGKPDYVSGAVRESVSGPTRVLRSVSGWFGRQTGWIVRGRQMDAENRRLREQVADLQGQNNALREAQIDYDRLRADIGFVSNRKPRPIAADVIALKQDPKFDTMIISRGSGDGIKPNSVVISRAGVVGRVFEVEPGTSAVLLLTDQKSGVGARVQRSRAVGLCEGDNSAFLSMFGLPDAADVKVGDVVVTSGLGGVYPGGLFLGSVSEVRSDSGNGGKVVRIRPQISFDTLEQVYVLP